MKKKRIIAVVVVIALVAAVIFVVSAAGAANAATSHIAVESIVRDTIVNTVTSRGEVALLNTETIFSNALAEIEYVYIERNDMVREGDVLLRFTERSLERLENRVREAELALRSAEINLADSRMPAGETTIESSRLAVMQTEQDIVNLETTIETQRRDLERLQTRIADQQRIYDSNRALFELGAVSQDTLDNLERALRDLRDEFENFENSLARNELSLDALRQTLSHRESLYSETRTRTDMQEVQNLIAQRQISVEQARMRLNDARRELEDFSLEVIAPMSGTITMLSVSRGETIIADRPIIEISDVENFVVRMDVNERNAAGLAIGQDVEITGAVLGRLSVYGEITRIGSIAEQRQTANGMERVIPIEVKVHPSAEADVLRPGFSLDGRITLEVKENIVVVPILATMRDRDGDTFVFVVRYDNALEQRVITLGLYADMTVEAIGIYEGEVIVSQPTLDMYEGMIINPLNPADIEA
ncbi:MAG: efflux RND transporter periplasmic adaptor subunit [Defluviitaleaceae bacterium]|nr:efflux RND transporter periplasmic adaptor subunit [Defluviitaleaceae bacterium]